jgi:hypothetical protein
VAGLLLQTVAGRVLAEGALLHVKQDLLPGVLRAYIAIQICQQGASVLLTGLLHHSVVTLTRFLLQGTNVA